MTGPIGLLEIFRVLPRRVMSLSTLCSKIKNGPKTGQPIHAQNQPIPHETENISITREFYTQDRDFQIHVDNRQMGGTPNWI